MDTPGLSPSQIGPSTASFIVRVWPGDGEGSWRCLLIDVASGERLALGPLQDVGPAIAAWLDARTSRERPGIR